MKRLSLSSLASLILLVHACNLPTQSRERDINVAGAKWMNDAAIQNAIIAQHTLYPYHFIANSHRLNELGEHDFGVLLLHFQNHPGSLNVRRGSVPLELQEARVRFVTERLLRAGIVLGPIEDGAPGGEGMLSEHVLPILMRDGGETAGEKQGSTGSVSSGARSAAVANQGASIK